MAHELIIKKTTYFIQGDDTHTLKEICKILDIKYDNIQKSKLSENQDLIKIWNIGELSDFLKNN